MLFSLTGMFGRMGVVIYYYIYVLKRFDLISPLMVLPTLFTAVTILITAKFVDRIGRKKLCTISYIGAAVSLIGIYFTSVSNITMLMILTSLYGAFLFATPIPMAMIADAIDYGEHKTGVRADGTSYATVSLSTKIASAIGGAVGIMIIAAFGYVANQDQTPQAIHGINFVANLLPAVCYLLTLIPLYIYPLNQKRVEEIRKELRSKEQA
jgi:GPH family glycoside/pentoside/hexuronide:cation symporter/probable glucitol transport protein GutA